MRKFVAACCCAIVGLQVLIAVPLVTCLVVLGLIGETVTTHVAMDAPPVAPMYPSPMLKPTANATAYSGPSISPLPPPLPPTAPPAVSLALPTCPMPTDCLVSPAPSICSAPEATVATLPPPISPQVEMIAELREKVGSPLAESSLAGDDEQTRTDSIAALERVAANEGPLLDPSDPKLKPEVVSHCPAQCPAHCPAQLTIVESLQAAADQLYLKGQSLEADGNFDRADQLRGLAREIRREIHTLRREAGEGPPPGAVKAAAYHEPSPEEPAKISAIPVRSTTLLPVRAELAEPMPLPSPRQEPPLMITVQPRIILEEEDESRLGIPIDPENPAPSRP